MVIAYSLQLVDKAHGHALVSRETYGPSQFNAGHGQHKLQHPQAINPALVLSYAVLVLVGLELQMCSSIAE